LAALAEKLVDLAARGLVRRKRLDKDGCDELGYLAPIARLVAKGQCPADELLEASPRSGEALRRHILGFAQV
jgi:gamma-glutamylcysteine synthetase